MSNLELLTPSIAKFAVLETLVMSISTPDADVRWRDKDHVHAIAHRFVTSTPPLRQVTLNMWSEQGESFVARRDAENQI
jgi:hypothetical protein